MKIQMHKTATAEDIDGTEYVFGPAGREYAIGEGGLTKSMADKLIKSKAAKNLKKSTEASTDGTE